MKKIVCCFLLMVMPLLSKGWSAEPLKLGSVGELSGTFKDVGERYLQGATHAASVINRQGGILGRDVKVIPVDSEGKPEIATEKIREAILKNNIRFFGQGGNSKIAGVLSYLAKEHNVIGFSWGSAAASLTGAECNRNFFRTTINTDMQSNALANWVAKAGKKRVYCLAPDYVFGKQAVLAFKKRLKKSAPSIEIAGEEYHKQGETDFTPYLARVLSSQADMIFAPSWGNDLRLLIRQSHELGVKAKFSCYYLNDSITITSVGNDEAVIGNITAECYMLSISSEANKAYIDGFYKEFGQYPSCQTTKSYMGVMFWADAVKKAGKDDPDAVIKAWEGLAYESPAGKQYMRPYDHQNQMPIWIAEIVKENKFYKHPFDNNPVMIPVEDISVPVEETGCPGLLK